MNESGSRVFFISVIVNVFVLCYIALFVVSPTSPSAFVASQLSKLEEENPDKTEKSEDIRYIVNSGGRNQTDQFPTEAVGVTNFPPCDDYTPKRFFGQRGNYWILFNYFISTLRFRCNESLTYTTNADWTFLDNLIPILERWQGPISITIYAPGTDFQETVTRIQFLRECVGSPLVKDFVTFHIFFDHDHIPQVENLYEGPENKVNCSTFPPNLSFGGGLSTYKKQKELLYPINLARNVAREMSQTLYVFPSDIELYPSPNLIPEFLEMIRSDSELWPEPRRKVFVLSVFEVEKNVEILPQTKEDVVALLGNKTAVPFHQSICAYCHRIPEADKWLQAPITEGLHVFHVAKRHSPYQHWEPFFIGTKFDPIFDERLSWDGRRDKMIQGFVLCLLDYEFHVLDNAFLVHRPGIKRPSGSGAGDFRRAIAYQNGLISKIIAPELQLIYGKNPECHV